MLPVPEELLQELALAKLDEPPEGTLGEVSEKLGELSTELGEMSEETMGEQGARQEVQKGVVAPPQAERNL